MHETNFYYLHIVSPDAKHLKKLYILSVSQNEMRLPLLIVVIKLKKASLISTSRPGLVD